MEEVTVIVQDDEVNDLPNFNGAFNGGGVSLPEDIVVHNLNKPIVKQGEQSNIPVSYYESLVRDLKTLDYMMTVNVSHFKNVEKSYNTSDVFTDFCEEFSFIKDNINNFGVRGEITVDYGKELEKYYLLKVNSIVSDFEVTIRRLHTLLGSSLDGQLVTCMYYDVMKEIADYKTTMNFYNN